MSTQTIIDTIDIIDHGASVEVVLQVGHIQHANASIALRDAIGATNVANPMKPGTPYSLGKANDLVGKKITVCAVHLADAGGGNGHPYFAICNFYQGGVHVGSTTPFSGTYPPGMALADAIFVTRFS